MYVPPDCTRPPGAYIQGFDTCALMGYSIDGYPIHGECTSDTFKLTTSYVLVE
jgi:hypothetical protein